MRRRDLLLLFGLEGYLGNRYAQRWLIEEQELLWLAEHGAGAGGGSGSGEGGMGSVAAADRDVARLHAAARAMGLESAEAN